MAELLGLLVPITALLIPIYLIKRRYDLREAEKREQLTGGESRRELEELREERKLLQSRIENLESIVCSVDYELNMRLSKLLADGSGGDLAARGGELMAGGADAGAPEERAPGSDLTAAATGSDEERAPESRAAPQGEEEGAFGAAGAAAGSERAGAGDLAVAPAAGARASAGAASPSAESASESAASANAASANTAAAGGAPAEVARAPTAAAKRAPSPAKGATLSVCPGYSSSLPQRNALQVRPRARPVRAPTPVGRAT